MSTDSSAVCVLCPDRERIPFRPPVCASCRAWLASMLGDLRIYSEQLSADAYLVPDERVPLLGLNGPHGSERWATLDRNTHGHDPVNAALPSGSAGNRPLGAEVRAQSEMPAPINLDVVDILAPDRPETRSLFIHGLLGLDPDQVGHPSLATELGRWVRDWIGQRDMGESVTSARPDELAVWLQNRVDWACDDFDRVDEFAEEIRSWRSILQGVLGLKDVPDYKVGVACPECRARSLFRRHGGAPDGQLWIDCSECSHIMMQEEYDEYVIAQAGEAATTAARMIAWVMTLRALSDRADPADQSDDQMLLTS